LSALCFTGCVLSHSHDPGDPIPLSRDVDGCVAYGHTTQIHLTIAGAHADRCFLLTAATDEYPSSLRPTFAAVSTNAGHELMAVNDVEMSCEAARSGGRPTAGRIAHGAEGHLWIARVADGTFSAEGNLRLEFDDGGHEALRFAHEGMSACGPTPPVDDGPAVDVSPDPALACDCLPERVLFAATSGIAGTGLEMELSGCRDCLITAFEPGASGPCPSSLECAPESVTASDLIDAFAHSDVREAEAASPTVYGRSVSDGLRVVIESGDLRIQIHDACPAVDERPDCIDPPNGVRELWQLLGRVAEQQVESGGCSAP